ncbi:hypothetical protein [Pseudomonas typographi]|uniref:Uncharacterized protein n=1 Tax=Pseudomonas typographi TaxID=2715964 RepID=A0ABR7Z0E9_9PSED|nr:hypothetical protein [Pseudomonas typographi]MBD1551281.1 hypothetical protein [Pseudomonas typographi]MBD1588838.1 hypothetical protein [Pseudomonas typographi]MBD1598954.1 hypothetical protein [Pseudomonas typographi]
MATKAPNEDTPGRPTPGGGRNDPAIDPQGEAGKQGGNAGESTKGGGDSAAKGNSYSPDFAPKPEDKPGTPRDADIDTSGG